MRRQKKSTKKERRQKKPTKLTERDLMRLALAVSRSTEIAATLEALNARGRDLSGAQQAAAAELQGLRFELGGRYRLEAGDRDRKSVV